MPLVIDPAGVGVNARDRCALREPWSRGKKSMDLDGDELDVLREPGSVGGS